MSMSSIGFTVIVGSIVLLLHQITQARETSNFEIMGQNFDFTPLVEAGFELPILVLAIGLWVGLASLSRLLVARQVRGHLMTKSLDLLPNDSSLIDSDVEVEQNDTGFEMAERMLLEAFLSLINSGSRALAVTFLLVMLNPVVIIFGLFAVWAMALTLMRFRFRAGQAAFDNYQSANRAQRLSKNSHSNTALIDSIFQRDRHINRLPLGQACLLVGIMIALVFIPEWVLQSEDVSVPALVVSLLWLQAVVMTVTEMGSFGWRQAQWFARNDSKPAPTNLPQAEVQNRKSINKKNLPSIQLFTSMPEFYPNTGSIWVSPDGAQETLILIPGSDDNLGGASTQRITRVLAKSGFSVLVIRTQYQAHRDGRPPSVCSSSQIAFDRPLSFLDTSRSVIITCEDSWEKVSLALKYWRPIRCIALAKEIRSNQPGFVLVDDDEYLKHLLSNNRLNWAARIWFDHKIDNVSLPECR